MGIQIFKDFQLKIAIFLSYSFFFWFKRSVKTFFSKWIFHFMTWNLNLFRWTRTLSTTFSTSICFYIALDTEQIPYINHLMEKLMHMTADIATNSSVGIDDSVLVGDDKSHFDWWNVKKLLFLLWWMLLLLLFPFPYIAAGCSPFIMWTITLAGSVFHLNGWSEEE